ncbi:MAG: BatA domain-containing protein [Pirellula sp.]|nr:BatA domain-containing protein [Pirellula sp.]
MNFLQPWLLLALPLLAIPIVIHLIHLRRYQSIPWAAMQFLLTATKMSSGYSRLRQWLVLALRALALAALVFFMARPLASGVSSWLASDVSQLQILVLDRSPSMQQTVGEQGTTKLQAVLDNYIKWNTTVGTGATVVFTSAFDEPLEFASAQQLLGDPRLQGNSLTSDLPALVENATRYIEQKGAARATIWIATDRMESDWKSQSGEWGTIRSAVKDGSADIRFQVLLADSAMQNRSIQLEEAKLVPTDKGSELSLSCRVLFSPQSGAGSSDTKQTVPLEIRIGEANTLVNVEVVSGLGELKGFRVPVEQASGKAAGWGSIQLPPDSNLADNIAYFAFEPPVPRKTLIVSEDATRLEAISLAANISPDGSVQHSVQIIEPSQLSSVLWEDVVFVVWHGPLPPGEDSALIKGFVERGGQVLFLPPEYPTEQSFMGLRWSAWVQAESASTEEVGQRLGPWRNDTVLLGNTQNGSAVPLGDILVTRYCTMETSGLELASLPKEIPWLVRLEPASEAAIGTAYAMASTSQLSDLVQRMIHEGSERLGRRSNRDVEGTAKSWSGTTELVLGNEQALSNRRFEHAGVYREESRTFAQNRKRDEDTTIKISDQDLERTFEGLVWFRVDASIQDSGVVQEVWRWFAWCMLIALLAESVLSLPSKRNQTIRRT